jgi:hypothetical protein
MRALQRFSGEPKHALPESIIAAPVGEMLKWV